MFYSFLYIGFVSLDRYIPKYFIPFVAMVNGIVSLISLSVFSLLVYKRDCPDSRGGRWSPSDNGLGIREGGPYFIGVSAA